MTALLSLVSLLSRCRARLSDPAALRGTDRWPAGIAALQNPPQLLWKLSQFSTQKEGRTFKADDVKGFCHICH